MLHCGKIKIAAFLAFGLAGLPALAHAETAARIQDLLTCFQQLRPFSTSGAHATTYPSDQKLLFVPGKYADKSGVWVFSDQGASFVAISDSFANKPIAFNLNANQSVVYQPPSGSHAAQVWVRGAATGKNSGVSVLFRNTDDPEKRAPLEAELDAMVRGMARAWDTREDQLVEAVEQGKYLWVEVDLDHYRDAALKCQKRLNSAPETASIRSAITSEVEALNSRAVRSGTVHDEIFKPSGFLTTPQY